MSKAIFICGSLNQTTQMHQIARQLPAESFECFFSLKESNFRQRTWLASRGRIC